MIMDSVARRPEDHLFSMFVLFAFLAAGVLLYARLYGAPGMYESDNLMGEEIYRDLFIAGNPWELWGLPGAAQYVELGLYMALRWLAGDVHAAMALHGSLVACLFALSAAYAVAPLFDSPRARAVVYALAPLLAVLYPYPSASFMITSKLAHGQTLSAALFAGGFFLRRMDRAPSLVRHWTVFAGIALMIASDSLFVLWFCLPALAMIAWRVWTRRLPLVAGACWWGAMACSWLAGKAVDAWLRNFPVHFSPVNFGFARAVKSLVRILMDTGAALFSSPLTVCWFVLGCAGLAWALRGTSRQREGAAFFLLCMAINLLGVAASGQDVLRYVFLWQITPYSLGVLLFAGLLREWLPGVARRFECCENGLLGRLSLSLSLSLSLAAGLGLGAWHAWQNIRPPYYPPLARELDDLARARGVRTGIAGYWDARLVTMLSREGVQLIPVHEYGYAYSLYHETRSMLQDRVDMLIANANSKPYDRLNRDLEIRANGEPDEIVRLSDSIEALIYRQGAHHPTEAELLLDGKRFVPEMAAGDRLQWQGNMALAEGLTLFEVRTAPRKERHVAMLFFREPFAALQGKKLSLAAAGDRTPRHMRRFAARVSPQGDGWLDRLYFLFVPKRRFVINMDNSVPLPDGGTLVWWKLPNGSSTEWTAIFVHGGAGWRRIK